jgi:Na+/H+-dicarboxylate symporter
LSGLGHMRGVALWNLGAMAAGVLLGLTMGKMSGHVTLLAWIPVTFIKALATPLLFLAILHGLMSDQINGSGVRRLLIVCAVNGVAAIFIAMALVRLFNPGESLRPLVLGAFSQAPSISAEISKTPSWNDAIKSLVPDSMIGPFVQNNIPAVLILAIITGVAIRSVGVSANGQAPWMRQLKAGTERGLDVITRMMSLVLRLMPLAIFASVAKAVGEHGVGVFSGLLTYVGICVGGMLIQILIIYHSWILGAGRVTLRAFWSQAKVPVIHAFGVNSSLAALPSTLNALDKLGCPSGASRLGACVGTNLNNDGILLYEVAALFMLGQASGLDWGFGQQVWLAGVCVLATLGVSGFPEAGVIALSLVLSSAGLPSELLPLLLPVDWLVARMRSATNVVSDITVSLALESSVLSGSASSGA